MLVVEDEFYIADDLATALSAAGLEVVGPAYSVSEALREVERAEIDGAIVDINVKNELAFPVADALSSQGIPFVITTGYDAQHLEAQYRQFEHLPATLEPASPPSTLLGDSVACCGKGCIRHSSRANCKRWRWSELSPHERLPEAY